MSDKVKPDQENQLEIEQKLAEATPEQVSAMLAAKVAMEIQALSKKD